MTYIRYQGVQQDGSPSSGMTDTGNLCEWVEARFDEGWRNLTVFSDLDGRCDEVGGIGYVIGGRVRTWWAE